MKKLLLILTSTSVLFASNNNYQSYTNGYNYMKKGDIHVIQGLSYCSGYYDKSISLKQVNLCKTGVLTFVGKNKLLTKEEFNSLDSNSLSNSIESSHFAKF